jgi:hypothetical protein
MEWMEMLEGGWAYRNPAWDYVVTWAVKSYRNMGYLNNAIVSIMRAIDTVLVYCIFVVL